jgi:hypothetical protein
MTINDIGFTLVGCWIIGTLSADLITTVPTGALASFAGGCLWGVFILLTRPVRQ